MPELAYVNGVFTDLCDAKVSVEDRGFQFGDGVYEVVVSHSGRIFLLEQHMRRLKGSLEAIQIAYDLAANPLEPIIAEGIQRSGLTDAMVYIQITRGVAPRSHTIPKRITPTLVMTFKPFPEIPDEVRRRGAAIMTMRDTRWTKCYIKAITLLPNVLAKTEAVHRGFDDALFVDDAGQVRECTSANVFLVSDRQIVSPPRTEAVLHGITQAFLFECAAAAGCRVAEQSFDVDALIHADEVFVSSSLVEVLGVTSIDGHQIADGSVGPMTQRLLDEYRKQIRRPAEQVAP